MLPIHSAKTSPSGLIASSFTGDEITLRALNLRERVPLGLYRRPAGVHEYFFVYCHQAVTVVLDGVNTVCPAGTMVIWEPGDTQEYGCQDDAWLHSYLDCSGPFVRKAIVDLHLPLRTPFLCPPPAHVEQYLESLAHEITDRTIPDVAIVRNLFDNWLRELAYLAHDDGQQRRDIPAGPVEARAYLETHYAEPITVEVLADRVNMSATHLHREFKRYFHISPMAYLIEVRMRRAGDLLHDPQLAIAAVAERVGFQDANYFSLAFKKYHGVTPRAWRRHAGGAHAEQRREEERQLREFHQWLREGWRPVYAADFAQVSTLDPRLQVYWHDDYPLGQALLHPAPELLALADGTLQLHPIMRGWVCLRWSEALSEEVRWDLTIDHPPHQGLNLYLSVSGDIQTGYRARLYGSGQLALETVQHGRHDILVQHADAIPQAAEYRICFWRSGNVFNMEVNGRRVLTYHDPLPPSGTRHHTCAIGLFCSADDCLIRRLHLFTRQAPRYVDILEPGRVMLRQGFATAAAEWFANLLHTQEDARVLREARYLVACAIPIAEHTRKEAALRLVADDEDNPFRVHALRDLGLLHLHRRNYPDAVAVARRMVQVAPHDPTPQQIADHLIEALRNVPHAEGDNLFSLVQQLPVTRLNLPGLGLTSLEPLRGMALTELGGRGNYLTDLTPLATMPLHVLDIGVNAIEDIRPLQGMPLRDFQCFHNRIGDLSPLEGMPLASLVCYENTIADLMPVRGMPLQHLVCHDNHIATLAPLAGLPLRSLLCMHNRITDLTPLRKSPLTLLGISGNPVTDLQPLSHLPLTSLEIAETPLDAANRRVVTGLPLERFMHGSCAPEAWTMLDDLPRLHYLNHHTVAHARALASTLERALTVWQRGTMVATMLQPATALRQFAHEADGVAYLAVPLWLTRAEAEAFCAWQGGRLPRPVTPERVQALSAYLLAVTEAGWYTLYHLGLDDAMWTLPYWNNAPYMEDARRTGEAYLKIHGGTNSMIWQSEASASEPKYVLIEWAEN